MIDTIAATVAPGETRVALIAAGRTVEVRHRRVGRESVVGNLYNGRVARVEPSLRAAFVDIGLDRAGFLNVDDARPDIDKRAAAIGTSVHEGQAVLVQVVRDPIGGKGARLTMRPTLPSHRLVYAPGRRRTGISRNIVDGAERDRLAAVVGDLAEDHEGLVLRTSAVGANRDTLAREIEDLRGLWREIEETRRGAPVPACLHRDVGPLECALRDHGGDGLRQAVVDSGRALADARRFCARYLPDVAQRLEHYRESEPLFERFGVEAALDEALGPRVTLPSGGGLIIEETEALTAIDVNAERAVDGIDPRTNAFRTNLEAAREIARQLRLRAIGGLIVIDFLRMDDAQHRRRVIAALTVALAGDRAARPPVGFTALGLVEMTRQRTRPSLADVLCDPCARCDGYGRRKSPASVALDIARAVERAAPRLPLTVIAAPEVAAALAAPVTGVLAALAERLGGAIAVRADPDFGFEKYHTVSE